MQYDAQVLTPVLARIALPENPAGFAYALYAALRAMDNANADVIVVQTPPTEESWNGINDRLRRAAHDSSGILSRLLQG
jgi:L-threonylcarbamoyladenylate synthase